MKTKKMTTLALLIALNVVLCLFTPIRFQNYKFTLEAFPVLVAGFMFGPTDGLIVGAVGSAIYQLLFSGYGITLTTPLWILPHAFSGWLVGCIAEKKNFNLSRQEIIITCIVSAVVVTSLNTLALYVDAKVYGYYSFALVFSVIPIKILVGICLAVLYSLIIPQLLQRLRALA